MMIYESERFLGQCPDWAAAVVKGHKQLEVLFICIANMAQHRASLQNVQLYSSSTEVIGIKYEPFSCYICIPASAKQYQLLHNV